MPVQVRNHWDRNDGMQAMDRKTSEQITTRKLKGPKMFDDTVFNCPARRNIEQVAEFRKLYQKQQTAGLSEPRRQAPSDSASSAATNMDQLGRRDLHRRTQHYEPSA